MIPADLHRKLAFVICTEPGNLERKSVMLVKTLRAFGGAFSHCKVISYSPRVGKIPGQETLDFFRDNNVEVVLEPLNRNYAAYGFGNKVLACANAEQRFDFERIVFLDSDMFILREPRDLWTDDRNIVKLKPVEHKKAGSDGTDEHTEYWQRLFAWASIDKPVFVHTSLSGERIYGYWNAGVIDAPGQEGFYRSWLANFAGMINEGLIHPKGMTFMDQISLAITVQQQNIRVEQLEAGYNYPVNKTRAANPGHEMDEHSQVVIAHYHKIFDAFPLSNPFDRLLGCNSKAQQLNRIIMESGFTSPANHVRYRMKKFMKKFA